MPESDDRPAPGSLAAIAERYRSFNGSGFGLHGPTGPTIPASTNPPAPPPIPTVRDTALAYLEHRRQSGGFGLQSMNGFAYQRKPPVPPPPIVTPPKPKEKRR
jgi:hypothetical protein